MRYVAHRGKMPIKKWVFRGKMGVFELGIIRTSNQTRKVKWYKMQVFFLKLNISQGMKD